MILVKVNSYQQYSSWLRYKDIINQIMSLALVTKSTPVNNILCSNIYRPSGGQTNERTQKGYKLSKCIFRILNGDWFEKNKFKICV